MVEHILDYATLKVIWWVLVGVLLTGFALTDGFDLGIGALLRVLGKTDLERRALLNAIGPTWDGNQVWLILGAGAVFAAEPLVYAGAFSALYPALLAALFALFFRPTGFEYRSKLKHPRWRDLWDWGLVIGGAVPAFLFGAAFGILLQGVPFRFDASLRLHFAGSFFALLTPFTIFAGLMSLALLAMHGAAWANLKVQGDVQARAQRWIGIAGGAFAVLFVAGGIWLAFLPGYRVVAMGDPAAALDPRLKQVAHEAGAWLANFHAHPVLWLVPALALAAVAAAWALRKRPLAAFLASSVAVVATLATIGATMFPFLMPSSLVPDHSLTAWDASSSHKTLAIMLIATVVFLPLILAYTRWVYRVLRGPVDEARIARDEYGAY